ncbi:MAG: hypothetical protein H0U76_22155 [Ktedonobacteraceae bacterium]|nr:hypothetical protein [Ktedonobacteraceae bacterium]
MITVPTQEEIAIILSWTQFPVDGDYPCLIVRGNAQVASYVQYQSDGDVACIYFLETRALLRRRGYARMLVAYLQERFLEITAHIVVRESHAFWLAAGFSPEYPHILADHDWVWHRERSAFF